MSADPPLFRDSYSSLTGHPAPMAWQQRLYDLFVKGEIPLALNLPTGLGKTSVMAIWLIALAEQAAAGAVRLPRRLVYVVDRRTVVDQATDEALKLRNTLKALDANGANGWIRGALDKLCVDHNDDASPLAISTLRGELADNREWQADPEGLHENGQCCFHCLTALRQSIKEARAIEIAEGRTGFVVHLTGKHVYALFFIGQEFVPPDCARR